MKQLVCLFAAAALALTTASAFADPPDRETDGEKVTITVDGKKVEATFVKFGEWVTNGGIRTPSSTWVEADIRPGFRRLLRLKKSFLGALHETGKEVRQLK